MEAEQKIIQFKNKMRDRLRARLLRDKIENDAKIERDNRTKEVPCFLCKKTEIKHIEFGGGHSIENDHMCDECIILID